MDFDFRGAFILFYAISMLIALLSIAYVLYLVKMVVKKLEVRDNKFFCYLISAALGLLSSVAIINGIIGCATLNSFEKGDIISPWDNSVISVLTTIIMLLVIIVSEYVLDIHKFKSDIGILKTLRAISLICYSVTLFAVAAYVLLLCIGLVIGYNDYVSLISSYVLDIIIFGVIAVVGLKLSAFIVEKRKA